MLEQIGIAMKTARIYGRVSTEEQDFGRQYRLEEEARKQGYYVAKVYMEKASGTTTDRPKLNELIEDLQPGDVIIAENIDRISRLPLQDAERLINRIKDKGAVLAIPGLLDLSQLNMEGQSDMAKIYLNGLSDMLLKVSLLIARQDYETRRDRQQQGIGLAKQQGKYKGRRPDTNLHRNVYHLRSTGVSIAETAKLANCSPTTVKKIMNIYRSINDIPL